MREVVHEFLGNGLSRRGFLKSMTALGFTAASAEAILGPLEASELAASSVDVPGAVTVEGTGGDLVIAQAKAAGTRFLFSNPGSLEVGFFDALARTPDMQLIMGLHEGIVCSMADGYHKVTQKPAFVNVHVIAGTAQMAGQLYNSSRDGSALVVTAGMIDNEQWNDDLILAPRPGFDQKDVNRQFTKLSWEARSAETLGVMTRRAFKVAATEPGGPVYLAITDSALETKGVKGQILPAERFMLRGRVRADKEAIETAARMLIEAKRPILVVGDEVWKSGAQDELLKFAETFGLPVFMSNDRVAFASFPSHHPLQQGRFNTRAELAQAADLICCIGSRDIGGWGAPESHTPAVVRMGMDTNNMGRTHATDVALIADVKEALADLGDAVSSLATAERIASMAKAHSEEAHAASSARHADQEAEERANLGNSPMHPDELGAVLAKTLDPDSIVIEENLTGRYDAFRFGHRDGEMMYLHNSGHGLGWGIGASTGAKLGSPDRPVVCTIGDGSVMYSAAGFWTQARYGIPVLTVVWNNHNYQTVRRAFHRYQGTMAQTGQYAGMYLGDPDIDFVQLAKSQGLSAERVEQAADLEGAIRRGKEAIRAGTPHVIDVEVARYDGGAESTWHQKFNLAEERTRKV